MKGNPVAVFETSLGEIEAENLGLISSISICISIFETGTRTNPATVSTVEVQFVFFCWRLESSKDFLGSSAADSLEFY